MFRVDRNGLKGDLQDYAFLGSLSGRYAKKSLTESMKYCITLCYFLRTEKFLVDVNLILPPIYVILVSKLQLLLYLVYIIPNCKMKIIIIP